MLNFRDQKKLLATLDNMNPGSTSPQPSTATCDKEESETKTGSPSPEETSSSPTTTRACSATRRASQDDDENEAHQCDSGRYSGEMTSRSDTNEYFPSCMAQGNVLYDQIPVRDVGPGRQSHCKEVILELINNWGHPAYIGLTDIQFYNKEQKQIQINPAQDIVQTSGISPQTQMKYISALFDGVVKVNLSVSNIFF